MTIPSWPGSPEWPEHPGYPYPPARPIPRREGPVAVPIVDMPSGTAEAQLLARRRVLVTGTLDAEETTRVAAELMALDGQSADDVELVVNSDGGPLAGVLTVLDVIGSMRANVRTACIGRARGTAAVLLACGTGERRVAPNALLSLRCVQDERVEGTAEEVRRQLSERDLVRHQVLSALAAATGRDEAELSGELDDGALLEPEQAKAAGLVDVIERPRHER